MKHNARPHIQRYAFAGVMQEKIQQKGFLTN